MWKPRKIFSIVMTYIFIVTTILQGTAFTAKAEELKKASKPLNAIPGQVILKVKDTSNEDYLKTLKDLNGNVINKNGQEVLVEVKPEVVGDAIAKLQNDSNVEFAEVNALGKKQGDTAAVNSNSDFLNYSNIKEAWSLLPALANQKQVIIGVVDSGVSTAHPDLVGKVLTSGYNYVSNNTTTNDDNGHGTQVAGVIAGTGTSDGTGTLGVAGNANVKILPVKVLDSNGNGTSFNVSQGIKFAADNGAAIINVSINGEGYSKAIADAVTYAQSKGCLVISSAGDEHDYAENYWPNNVEGTVVVANSSYKSNYGKAITIAANGNGRTATIGNTYCNVTGSSFSAAVVSGAAALAEIKYPTYNSGQISNMLKNSTGGYWPGDTMYNHDTGYGMLNGYKLLNSSSALIEIVTPYSGANSNSDVQLKVKALDPASISKLEVYLNDSTTPYKTITGDKSTYYNQSILAADLAEGANKIAVKAYNSSGAVYTDLRYIREYKSSSNYIALNIKDINGNVLTKGTRVYLTQSNGKTVSDLADDNGKVTFYNTIPNTNYTVQYTSDNVDQTTGINHPVFFQMTINSSNVPSVIDKTNLRTVNISAVKADNTPLTGSDIYYGIDGGKQFQNVFDSNGNGYIYVTDEVNKDIRLVNVSEGYILDKTFPQSIKGISKISFAVDSSVTKVSITNNAYSGSSSQSFSIKGVDDKGNYELTKVSVKNNAVYLSKGMDYAYYYGYDISYNNKVWQFQYIPEHINTSSNAMTLTYGKPSINVTRSYYAQDSRYVPLQISMQDAYNHKLSGGYANQLCTLYDSSGNKIGQQGFDLNSYYISYDLGTSLSSGTYNIKASADFGPLGVITSDPFSFTYTANSSSNTGGTTNLVNITVKAPSTSMTNYYVYYSIYDTARNQMVYSGDADYNTTANGAVFSLDKSYFSSNYVINITGNSNLIDSSTGGYKFYYSRPLPAVPASSLVIDNSSNTAKQISIKLDDTSKQSIVQKSDIEIYTGIYGNTIYASECSIDSNGLTSIYLDKGSYGIKLKDEADGYLLYNNFTINDTNSTAQLATAGAAKLSFNVTNLKGFISANTRLNLSINGQNVYDSLNIKKGQTTLVSSSSTLVTNFSLQSFDAASGKLYYYNYYSVNQNVTGDYTFNLSDFVFKMTNTSENVSLPDAISNSYTVTSGGYNLSSVYSDNLYNFMNEFKNDLPIYLNIANSSGSIVGSTQYDQTKGYATISSATYNDPNMASGTYNVAIMLPKDATNVSGNTFAANVDSSNLQRIRIMNPFDVTQPAVKANVTIKGTMGSSFYTDSNGYIYTKKGAIQNASDIVIKAYNQQNSADMAIYSPDSITQDSSGTIVINKSISVLKKLHIITGDSSGSINLANSSFNVQGNGNYYSDYLSGGGEKNLYVASGTYTVSINNINDYSLDSSSRYYLVQAVNLTADTDVTFNSSTLGCIKINGNGTNYSCNLSFSGDNSTYYLGNDVSAIYVTPLTTVTYNAYVYDSSYRNSIRYSGTIKSQAGQTNTINMGKKYSITGALDSSSYTPDGQITASIAVTDEYGNNVQLGNMGSLSAVVTQNGNVVDTLRGSQLNDKYQFYLNSNVVGAAKIHFSLDLGSLGTVVSSDYDINIDGTGYSAVTITDPLGKPAAGGKVIIGTQQSTWFSQNLSTSINKYGTTLIKTASLQAGISYKIIISGNTADTNEPFIYYRDYNPASTSYGASNTQTVNMKTQLRDSGDAYGDFEVHLNNTQIYEKDFNTTTNGSGYIGPSIEIWPSYNNFNLYIDKGIYSFEMNLQLTSSGGHMDSYRLYKQDADLSTTNSILFDGINTSKLIPVYDGPFSYDAIEIAPEVSTSYIRYEIVPKYVYVTKMKYKAIYFDLEKWSPYSYADFGKDDFVVSDDITEVHFGKGPLYATDWNNQPAAISSCLSVGDNIYINAGAIHDTDGFTTSNYGTTAMTAAFSQNGVVKNTTSISSNALVIPQLAEGFYDLNIYQTSSLGQINIINKKVYIGANASSFVNVQNSYLDTGKRLDIYDGSNLVYSMGTNDGGKVPASILDTSKSYTVYECGNSTYNYVRALQETLAYSNGQWSIQAPSDAFNFTVSGIANGTLKLTDGKYKNISCKLGSTGNGSIYIQPGTYNMTLSGYDSSGKYYILNRTVSITSASSSYNFDLSNVCKLSLTNNFAKNPYETIFDITKSGSTLDNRVKYSELADKSVYVDKDTYTINTAFRFNGVQNDITGNYVADCSGTSAAINFGSSINVSVAPSKSSYNSGEALTVNTIVKDGAVTLNGFTSSDFTASVDIMHGSSVIKSFSGLIIPNYLKGESELRINIGKDILGNFSSAITPITINNAGLLVSGDINLDRIVDIYDLVLVSKDMGKQKGISPDWDGRCNIENSDNVIDIKDVAKLASYYNSKY
ncbi:MAG: S8 family serine peptidase [Bacillota bacterium]|nr:S8 family serine peptidase [Bacillota bacterium]